MELYNLINESFETGLLLSCLLGLLVGSFLNVVIHRLPQILKLSWRKECVEFLSNEPDIGIEPLTEVNNIVQKDNPLSLNSPASRCPHCGHKIRWYENIPVISWLFLRGKCSDCKTSISFRYPLVEIITAIASGIVFWKFGATWETVFALGFTWSLIALTGIDYDTQYLPDIITLPLAGAGLIANALGLFEKISPTDSIWGFIIGFLCLWVVNKLYYLITKLSRGEGQQGIGGGDFKLLAALGAWMSASVLPLVILMSSLIGSVVGVILLKINQGESKPFAFGPYIAIAGFVALIWGEQLISWYLGYYR